MNRHVSPRLVVGIAALGLIVLESSPARAQAWTPGQGEGAVTVQYQDAFVKYHQLPTIRLDRGHIRGETLMIDVTYGITDKMTVSVAMPYVASKYSGSRPHQLPLDSGKYHSTFQDLRFDVRYNVSRKGIVITPFVGTIVPSHDYEYFAHSAVGRNVRELQIGAYWAKLLDPIAPGLFLQGRYSYGFAQRILDISHNRSNLDVELGYFAKPELRVFALGASQLTHGGVDLSLDAPTRLGPILYPHHDQITRDNVLNVGAGVAYDLTATIGVYGSVIRTVAGRNVHALHHSLTAGVSWSFTKNGGRSRAAISSQASREGAESRTLARCACQKSK